MRAVDRAGFEVGIHAYNHYRWQDHLPKLSLEAIRTEFGAARQEFTRIFGRAAHTAGAAAGWQSDARSRAVYDEAELLYASDTRGTRPFFPRVGGRVFQTLEIPSTLPTFDELLGRPEFPDAKIASHYLAPPSRPAERLHPSRGNRGHGTALSLPRAPGGLPEGRRGIHPAR